jgi:hypothetical protein
MKALNVMIFIDLGILEVRFRLVFGMWGDGYTDIYGEYVHSGGVYWSPYLNPSFLTLENIYLPTECLLQTLV